MSEATPLRRGRFRLGDAFALGLVQSGASLVSQVARSKISAIYLGPTGVGMIAEVMQICRTAFIPSELAVGAALVQGLAKAHAEQNAERMQALHRSALTVTVLLCTFGGVASVVGCWTLLPPDWGADRALLATLASVGLAAGAISGVYRQALIATALLRQVTLVGIANSLLTLALIGGGTILFGLHGFLGGLALGAIALIPPLIGVVRAALPHLGGLPWPRLERDFVRDAVALGTSAFLAGTLQQVALLWVRTLLYDTGGSELNGYFQAAWAIGFFYINIVLQSLGQFVFPSYAAASDTAELTERVDAAVGFSMRVAAPVTFGAVAVVDVLVHLLYDRSFDPSLPVLSLILVGNLSRVVNWCIGGTLMYRKQAVGHVLSAVYANLSFGTLCWLLLPRMGFVGVGVAYLISRLIGTVVISLITRAFVGIPLSPRRVFGSWGTTLMALGAVLLVEYTTWGRWCVLAASLVLAWRAGLIRAAWRRARKVLDRRAP